MYEEALRREIVDPEELLQKLIRLGLTGVDLTIEEFLYADAIGQVYTKLSGYDRTALAIAKFRKYPLLTGDRALRNAAVKEGVEVFGTIGLLDRMYESACISKEEYAGCLEEFLKHRERRLPETEIRKRLENIRTNV